MKRILNFLNLTLVSVIIFSSSALADEIAFKVRSNFQFIDPLLDSPDECLDPSPADLQEAKEKLQKLINRDFSQSTSNEETAKKALEKYDTSTPKAEKLTKSELETLLGEADIGTWITRGCWADGILDKFDSDADRCLSKDEIKKALDDIGVTPPPPPTPPASNKFGSSN